MGGKEKPILIRKSAIPRCFKGIKDRSLLPCTYFTQAKAWIDFSILDEILCKLNRKLQREQRKVISFFDNAPCHPPDMKGKYDQIKIVFFLPNCTSMLQPLDLGIQAFKLKYMKLMLTQVVSRIDECTCATDVCKTVDLLQAMRWIGQAWEGVSASTIKKCFAKVGFLTADGSIVSFSKEQSEIDPFVDLDNELTEVNALLKKSSDMSLAMEAIQADVPLPTSMELADNWEEQFFLTWWHPVWTVHKKMTKATKRFCQLMPSPPQNRR